MNLAPLSFALAAISCYCLFQLAERHNKPILKIKNAQLLAVVLQRVLWLALALLLTLRVLPDRLWALESDSGPPGTTLEAVRPEAAPLSCLTRSTQKPAPSEPVFVCPGPGPRLDNSFLGFPRA